MKLDEYIQGVQDTLQYWVDIHTTPEKWAEGWIIDDDAQYTVKECPILENNYFTFEWKKAAIRKMAENDKWMYNICPNCGCINEDGFSDCCEEPEQGEEPDTETLTEWFLELNVEPSERDLRESLEDEGFKTYTKALKDIIAPVVEEVNDVLKAFQDANSPIEVLQAVTWANHVCHVHGNIVKDYGELVMYSIGYNMINSISQDGLESVFSQDEINAFLSEEV